MASRVRITSIDALRAVTLFGIIIVHAYNRFGFSHEYYHDGIEGFLSWFIRDFYVNKFNPIFRLLFGISFYLILRNPLYSSSKFFWRCFLLMLIGLLNKFFYTYDVLMWYGICGMCLIPFRSLKNKYLFLAFVVLILLRYVMVPLHLGNIFFGTIIHDRYVDGCSFLSIITYPYAVEDYLRIVFNGGVFGTLALFVLGYWLARIGIIENLERIITRKVVAFWIIMFVISYVMLCSIRNSIFLSINNYIAIFAYSSIVVYCYYHNKTLKKLLKKFEPYGRLGLTNYSMQGVIGVILMGDFGLNLHNSRLTVSVLCFVFVYLLQSIFSYYWLKYYRYGPMEYIWRVLTERRIIHLQL